MSATESNSTDVQQRILLEVAYEAVENGESIDEVLLICQHFLTFRLVAGIPKEELAGSNASVYIGSFVKGKPIHDSSDN
jgi:acyl transferase domain-containing protein